MAAGTELYTGIFTAHLSHCGNEPGIRHKRVGSVRKLHTYKARDDPFAYPLDNFLETGSSQDTHSGNKIVTVVVSTEPTVVASDDLFTNGTTSTVSGHRRKSTLSKPTDPKFAAVLNEHDARNESEILQQIAKPANAKETTPVQFTTKSQISATFKPLGQQGTVPNRIKGKPLIMCMPDGIMFFGQTYFDFFGRVFARGRETNSKCVFTLSGTNSINASFAYTECGIPVSAKTGDANYQVEVVVSYDKENRLQSYLTHCLSQKLRYATEDLPKRIEEALEELNIVPIKIESQAPMPQCQMRVVQEEVESENHKYGPSNGTTVRDAYIGQTLRMEFTLNPSSAAFGFLIKNCTVLDKVSGERYTIIDNKGCSIDINIFAHPHYDTYHDLALVHWHAFRIPDNSMLSFQCDCVVCSEIVDDDGKNGCDLVPTPPICPEVVTSAALQNALLFDFSENNQIFLAQKRSLQNYDVNTSMCLSDKVESCAVQISDDSKRKGVSQINDYCLSPAFFAVVLSFSFVLFLIALSYYIFCTLRQMIASSNCGIGSNIDTVDYPAVPSMQRVLDDQSSSIVVESSFTK